MEEEIVGLVEHFYDKLSVAVVKLRKSLKVGDHLHINGEQTDFEQFLESMQVNHKDVKIAKKGDSAGIRLGKAARDGDIVYKVTE
jgi:U32 family peptidase